MENRLRTTPKNNTVSSLCSGDSRGHYYSLSHHETASFTSPTNNCAGAAANPTTANTLCMLVNGRRIQQRYKLLTDGVVQICRVPHAKNIIEKIRFSRFLRRWEEHYINLEQSQITSDIVSFLCCCIDLFNEKFSRMKVIWINQYHFQQLKIYLSGQNLK
jgi:hypothetical protein